MYFLKKETVTLRHGGDLKAAIRRQLELEGVKVPRRVHVEEHNKQYWLITESYDVEASGQIHSWRY